MNMWRLVFKRERGFICLFLFVISGASWWYLYHMSQMMPAHAQFLWPVAGEENSLAAPFTSWSLSTFAYILFMWVIMMVAMMVPGAAATILAYDSLGKNNRQYAHSLAFTLGYILVWSAFSLAATLLQWLLAETNLISDIMVTPPQMAAPLLICAGIYQCLAIKQSCLIHCQSPFEFLTRHLKPGLSGALKMGLHHGSYCLGCCWLLMLLLFVGGVMNLFWIAALTLFVLLEKILPFPEKSSYISGALLILLGGFMGLNSVLS